MVKVVPIVHHAVFRAKQFTETKTGFLEGKNSRPAPLPPPLKSNGDESFRHLLIQNFLDPLLSFLINFRDIWCIKVPNMAANRSYTS